MLIIVTGAIGSGKTTVCEKVVKLAQSRGYRCGGVLARKAEDGIVIEDIQAGASQPLASTSDIYAGLHIGKYIFSPPGIDFGLKALESGTAAGLLVVDELGPLELGGEGFINAIKLIRAGKVKRGAVVIRKELLSTFLPQLHTTPFVFETTLDNRDRLPENIIRTLFGAG